MVFNNLFLTCHIYFVWFLIICIELILLGVNLLFYVFSFTLYGILSKIFGFFILTITVAESYIGLVNIILYDQNCGNISFNNIFSLKS